MRSVKCSHAFSSCGCWALLIQENYWSLSSLSQDRGHVVFPLVSWYQTSTQRWVVYISKVSCGDGEMWVSVLVLGAAEHPVLVLPGPQYPCLSMTASSLIKWSQWQSLPSVTREADDVGTRCMWTWSAWIMRFCEWCVCESALLGEIPPITPRSQRPLVHTAACGPALWTGCLANSQSAAVLCGPFYLTAIQRHLLPEEFSLLTCTGSESLIFKCTLAS